MLIEFCLVAAPVAVALFAAAKLFSSHVSHLFKSRHERGLYHFLLLFEKLPDGVVGTPQIRTDIDRKTLRLAYLSQFPQRTLDISRIATIGVALLVVLATYSYFLWARGPIVYLLAIIAVAVAVAMHFRLVVGNFAANDARCHDLFGRLRAPSDLTWTPTDLFRRTPTHSADDVLERAADVRDRATVPLTTVEAVNTARVEAASRRSHLVATLAIDAVTFTVSAYDWLLRHLLGPYYRLKMKWLNEIERRRTARAEETGNVFKAAWLVTFFRAERRRLVSHREYLHRARNPLLRWVERTTARIDVSRRE